MAPLSASIFSQPRALRARAAVLAFVAGMAVLPGTAGAQPLAVTGVADLALTYKAICLDHAGEPEAQVAAAEPFGLTQQAPAAADQVVRLTNDHLSLAIQSTPALALCMIAARVPDGTSPALVAAQALPLLDAPVTALAVQDRTVSWQLGAASGLYVQVIDGGQTLGSFSLAAPAQP